MKRLRDKTLVKYRATLPTVAELTKASGGKNLILIYDERLASFAPFKNWVNGFAHVYAVRAGESLKRVEDFPIHVKKLLPFMSGFSPRENVIVAVGGGSVGDFAGFMASVLKRGVGYVHLPSTWLAAVDSAHGGKNGLNVEDLKNQVGTFYEAHAIFCVKELLNLQPPQNVRSAYGEVIKMALVSGAALFADLQKLKKLDTESLWKLLPKAVAAKNSVVKTDPKETLGIRQQLNLGHTLGHAFELERLLPHGLAVQIGLEFSTEWSFRRKILKSNDYEKLKLLYAKNKIEPTPPLEAGRLHLILKQDKKALSGNKIRFVFIQKPGRALVKEVLVEEIVRAACDLGWAK
jgi:3-dehydroquinate synthase